jgi:GNAT superfamily N-acetyltransferase
MPLRLSLPMFSARLGNHLLFTMRKAFGEVLWMPWCGDGLMAVRPDRRRQGIGTRLLAVAVELWPEADLMRQKLYSEEGSRLVESFLKQR